MKNLTSVLIALLSFCLPSLAQQTKTDLYADNIVIVFDASGSMEAAYGSGSVTRLSAAKSAVQQIISTMSDNTNVGLFVFGGIKNDNPVPLGPKNVAALNAAIASINADGGTPLGEYIQKAADQILQQRQKNFGYGRYKILVVTDGQASDSSLMNKVAPEVVYKRGLSLDVIGVGMTREHSLATMCSTYRSANDPEALKSALQAIVAETPMSTTAGEDDFAMINAFTDNQVTAVIEALSEKQNQPLFENPKVAETNASPDSQSAVASNPGGTSGVVWFFIIVVVFILAFIVVSGISR